MPALGDPRLAADVRDDLRAAQAAFWDYVCSAGNWWTGAERRAVVDESRAAEHCALCRARAAALSPRAVAGAHDRCTDLPEAAVDVMHRLRTDPGRLSRAWYEETRAAGLTDAQYVELVGLIAMIAGADRFADALGVPRVVPPAARPGAPSRHRPAGAKDNGAWVPTVAAADAVGPEADLYGGAERAPNIAASLSLVPDAARMLQRLGAAHYLPIEHVPDPTFRRGVLDRMQMELVAARVSALNQCFY